MPRPSARAARRGLHGEGSTATAAWRGEASEGRRFTRNRVHRAAGVGVPGVAVADKIRCPSGHRFTGKKNIPKYYPDGKSVSCGHHHMYSVGQSGHTPAYGSVYPVTSKSASCGRLPSPPCPAAPLATLPLAALSLLHSSPRVPLAALPSLSDGEL